MNRIFTLQQALLKTIDEHSHIDRTHAPSLDWEKIHMISCAKVGYLLGMSRGLDADLCACACAVHDFGRILSGSQENHGPYGAGPARTYLDQMNLFSQDELDMISLAVGNHSRKGEVGSPLEELVKDADLIDYASYGQTFKRQEQIDRYEKLMETGWPRQHRPNPQSTPDGKDQTRR
jgi:uncharacterized protein